MAALIVVGCGQGSAPAMTLEQQRAAAKGHAPTQEELAAAMAKLKTPGAEVVPPPGQKVP